MYIKTSLIFLCSFLCLVPVVAQIQEENIEQLIENIAQDTEDAEIRNETYLEVLADNKENLINLNTATYEELSQLIFLNAYQIAALLDYRNYFGKFVSIYELQGVNGFDLSTAKQLASFVTVAPTKQAIDWKARIKYGKHQIFMRYERNIELPSAYDKDSLGSAKYEGSPYRLYARYRYNYRNKISYGLTMEKDPGEALFLKSQKQGFDFYSAHLYLKDIGIFKHIAIGDYEIRFGQGLTVWNGFGFRKDERVMNLARIAPPIRQYTSVNENNFFRGIGASIGLGNWSITPFFSYKKTDANITQDTLDIDVITETVSLQDIGFHRTANEIEDKDALQRLDAGASIKYTGNKFAIGFNSIYTHFNKALQSSNQHAPYNLYRFQDKKLLNTSLDYRFLLGRVSFFGEMARSDNGGFAILNGALTELNKNISISLLHRHYTPDYQSLTSNAFAENTSPINEQGLFIGTKINPIPKWEINAYMDVYKHPWLKFQTDAPSHGVDYLALITYKPNRKLSCYLRFRQEAKGKNTKTPEEGLDTLPFSTQVRSGIRLHMQYQLNAQIRLKTRLEWSHYEDGFTVAENGFAILQDVVYEPFNLPLKLYTRLALFDTPSFQSRIYAYENDVLYAFSVPPYFNRGQRFYGMIKYELNRNISLWARYARTTTFQNQQISTTTGEVISDVPYKTQVKLMARIKF